MPNNMNKPDKGHDMPNKSSHGQSKDDMNRNASDRGQNMGYGKDTGMGQQGSGSKSGEGMSKPDSRTSQQ